MKIKNVELEFSFVDADDMERLENACKMVNDESEKAKNQEMTYAQTLRFECNLIDRFFDEAFGEGVALKLFNGKSDLNDKLNAFQYVMDEKVKQDKKMLSLYSKYKAHD